MIPALFTRISTGPNLSVVSRNISFDRGAFGDVCTHDDRLSPSAANLVCHVLCIFRVGVVVNRDPVPRRGQPQSSCAPIPLDAPVMRAQRDLIRQNDPRRLMSALVQDFVRSSTILRLTLDEVRCHDSNRRGDSVGNRRGQSLPVTHDGDAVDSQQRTASEGPPARWFLSKTSRASAAPESVWPTAASMSVTIA